MLQVQGYIPPRWWPSLSTEYVGSMHTKCWLTGKFTLLTHPPWTKWPPFRRRRFEMHFHRWTILHHHMAIWSGSTMVHEMACCLTAQPTIWTNVGLQLVTMVFCDVHRILTWHRLAKLLLIIMSFEIVFFKLLPHLTWANKLSCKHHLRCWQQFKRNDLYDHWARSVCDVPFMWYITIHQMKWQKIIELISILISWEWTKINCSIHIYSAVRLRLMQTDDFMAATIYAKTTWYNDSLQPFIDQNL